MKKIGMLILAIILIYMILISSVADINHGNGLVWWTEEQMESRV